MEITIEFALFIIAGMISFSLLALLGIIVSVRLSSEKHYDNEPILIYCESCQTPTNMDIMFYDGERNFFCPECWVELEPVMKREYEEMVRNGEIDPD